MPKKRGRPVKKVKPAAPAAPNNKTEMSIVTTPKKNTVVVFAVIATVVAGAFIYRSIKLTKQIKSGGGTPAGWFK